MIEEEVNEQSAVGGRLAGAKAHLRRARELQRRFRKEPIGGKLASLKKAVHWWTASAFDRQAKATEALLDAVEELAAVSERTATAAPVSAPSRRPVRSAEQDASDGLGSHGISLGQVMNEVGGEMLVPERLLVYSLVYGLRPARCLEIGTFRGGSAALVCAALEDLGSGVLVCVDPEPRLQSSAEPWLDRRATVLTGFSPAVLGEAKDVAGGPFDFALIDGDHSKEGVVRDTEGCLEHLADEAYLLFHDCHYAHVHDGIEEALAKHPELIDAGVLSTATNDLDEVDDLGRPVVWGGLRLVRYLRQA